MGARTWACLVLSLRNEGEGLFIVITDAAWLIWYTAGKLADCVIFADDH